METSITPLIVPLTIIFALVIVLAIGAVRTYKTFKKGESDFRQAFASEWTAREAVLHSLQIDKSLLPTDAHFQEIFGFSPTDYFVYVTNKTILEFREEHVLVIVNNMTDDIRAIDTKTITCTLTAKLPKGKIRNAHIQKFLNTIKTS